MEKAANRNSAPSGLFLQLTGVLTAEEPMTCGRWTMVGHGSGYAPVHELGNAALVIAVD